MEVKGDHSILVVSKVYLFVALHTNPKDLLCLQNSGCFGFAFAWGFLFGFACLFFLHMHALNSIDLWWTIRMRDMCPPQPWEAIPEDVLPIPCSFVPLAQAAD